MRQTKVQIYKHWLILAEELYEASEPNSKAPYIGDQRRRRLNGAIVFLALSLEAFINEIGLEFCGDEFASIDRLPGPDKWLRVPKLGGKRFCKEGREPYQSIQTIFAYRNLFAHFKPSFQSDDCKQFAKMKRVDHDLFKRLYRRSIDAMKLVSSEFMVSGMEWLDIKRL
jgi:hypothetical protein